MEAEEASVAAAMEVAVMVVGELADAREVLVGKAVEGQEVDEKVEDRTVGGRLVGPWSGIKIATTAVKEVTLPNETLCASVNSFIDVHGHL